MEESQESSSDSVISSPSASEGEYIVSDLVLTNLALESCFLQLTSTDTAGDERNIKFDLTQWSPEPPAGLHYLSVIPMGSQGYKLGYPQHKHVGKITVSAAHRKARLRDFHIGKTVGRDIIDSRKLQQAVGEENFNLVEELLENGADPSIADDKKRTPLHIAAAKGNDALVTLLLHYGADPNLKDVIGNTPMHLAACTNHLHVITVLLRAGTDLAASDTSGNTPLHLARARLHRIPEEQLETTDSLKHAATQVVEMMRVYLEKHVKSTNLGELDSLCDRLQNTSTREELNSVGSLLSDFARLELQKHGKAD